MNETLSEAERLGAALLFEQQVAWRTGADTPPWLCERARDADQPELARMAQVLVNENRDLLAVFRMEDFEFWRADGADRGSRALFGEVLAARFGPLPEAHQNTIERALPRQLTAWASKIWSARSLEELLRQEVALSRGESAERGKRWLLKQELATLENTTRIDIDAKIANAHPDLELPYIAKRVLWENRVETVFGVTTAQQLFVEGYILGVQEVLDSQSMRDNPLRVAVEEELAAALAFQRSYQ